MMFFVIARAFLYIFYKLSVGWSAGKAGGSLCWIGKLVGLVVGKLCWLC